MSGIGKSILVQELTKFLTGAFEAEQEARANGGGTFVVGADDPDQVGTITNILETNPQATLHIEFKPLSGPERDALDAAVAKLMGEPSGYQGNEGSALSITGPQTLILTSNTGPGMK